MARLNPAKARASKAASERKRRRDPVIGVALREVRRSYHRFRGSTAEDRDFARILKADPCSYCGGKSGEVDHIEPSVIGGDDHWWNLTAACRSCNARKNDSTLLGWIFRRILEAEAQREAQAAGIGDGASA